MRTFNLSTLKAEASVTLRVQDQPGPHSKFQATLGDISETLSKKQHLPYIVTIAQLTSRTFPREPMSHCSTLSIRMIKRPRWVAGENQKKDCWEGADLADSKAQRLARSP